MPVFKIEKTKDYTVMSNYHLQDKNLSYKAKGLLSFMLSLPDYWDYSVNGLVAVSKEGRKAILSSLKELEENKYLIREKKQDKKGRFDGDYYIYEKPYTHLGCTDKGDAEKDIQINTNNKNTNNKDKKDKLIPLVKELINRGFISESDLDIPFYDELLESKINEYGYFDVIKVCGYIMDKWKSNNGLDENDYEIINKYGYFKTALENNLKKINEDIRLDY